MNWLNDLHEYITLHNSMGYPPIQNTVDELMEWLKETYELNNRDDIDKLYYPCHLKLFLSRYSIISSHHDDSMEGYTESIIEDVLKRDHFIKLLNLPNAESRQIIRYWRKGNFTAIKNHLNKLAI